jgi:hypothetical protein
MRGKTLSFSEEGLKHPSMVHTPLTPHPRFSAPIYGLILLVLTIFCSTNVPAQPEPMPPPSSSIIFSGDTLKRALKELAPLIDPTQEIELDILDEQQRSYADKAAEIYEVMTSMCHVGTISPTVAILQSCASAPTTQTRAWSSFITELKKAAVKKPRLSTEQEQTLVDGWTSTLEPFGTRMYLVSSGTDLTPVTIQDLVSTTLSPKLTSLRTPLNASFSPRCVLNATSLGKRIDKTCAKSIPLPPFSAHVENGALILVRLAKEKGRAFIKLWNESPEEQSVLNETTLTVDIGKVAVVRPTPTPTPTPTVTRTPTNTPSATPTLDYGVTKEILAPGDETTTLDPVFGIRFADDSKFITAILSVQARLTEMPAGNESTARIRNLTTSRLHDDGVLELYFSPRLGGRFTTPLRASTTASISVTALVKDESGAINLLTTVEEVSFRTTSNDSPSGETVTRHVFALNGERAPTPTPSP